MVALGDHCGVSYCVSEVREGFSEQVPFKQSLEKRTVHWG